MTELEYFKRHLDDDITVIAGQAPPVDYPTSPTTMDLTYLRKYLDD